MRKVNINERVNTNTRINMNHFNQTEEPKVYKVFDDYYYPPREKILWRKRRKNLYFASSILCTVGGVICCVDIEDENSNVLGTTTPNKSYFIKKSSIKNTKDILELEELELSEQNKEELKEAIEIAKASLEKSVDGSVINLKTNSNEISNDDFISNSDSDLILSDVDEEYSYYYNLETELEKSLNDSENNTNMKKILSEHVSNAMKYWDYFEYYGYTYGIDPYLLVAIAVEESGGEHYETIVGGDNYNGYSYGIMQIEQPGILTKKITAYNYTTQSYDIMQINSESDVSSVSMNIKAGAMMFAQKVKENQYNPYVAIQSCNYGIAGVNYALSYYLADGDIDMTEEIFNDKERLSEYILSNDSSWLDNPTSSGLTAREWYSTEGWEKFGGGKGNSNYFEDVMKYYNGEELPYIVTNLGVKVYF